MDFTSIFGKEKLSLEEFKAKLNGVELVDSSKYVSKEKYDAQVLVAKDWKTKHKDLSDSVDGDEGYKKKLEQIEKDRDDFKTKYSKLEEEKTSLERTNILASAGVGEKFRKYALSEITGKVNETTDFNKALESWKTENGQFFEEKKETQKNNFTFNQPTGVNKTITTGKEDVSGQMNNVLRSALK